MNSHARTVQWLVWGVLAVVVVSISAAYLQQRASTPALPVYAQINDFALTNQMGQKISISNLRGQIWIGNIIFTRCAGPCARLSHQMQQLQAALHKNAQVRFVSLTADPDYDTPEVLLEYGRRFQADPARWFFLTGKKSDVYALAIKELKLTVIDNAVESNPDQDLFIHSQKFVVVDSSGHIRAYVDGDEPGTVSELARAVKALGREGNR